MRLEGARDYTWAINLCTEQRRNSITTRPGFGGRRYTTPGRQSGLDEGIKKLGPLVTLELCASTSKSRQTVRHCSRPAGHYGGEIAAQRTWLARRGDILVQAGKIKSAKAFQAALTR